MRVILTKQSNIIKNMKITIKGKQTEVSSAIIAVGILLLTIMAVLWPLATIWAINTMFATTIPFTFWTWLSCWVILTSLKMSHISNK